MSTVARLQIVAGVALAVLGAAISFCAGYMQRDAKDSGLPYPTGPASFVGSLILGVGVALVIVSRRKR